MTAIAFDCCFFCFFSELFAPAACKSSMICRCFSSLLEGERREDEGERVVGDLGHVLHPGILGAWRGLHAGLSHPPLCPSTRPAG